MEGYEKTVKKRLIDMGRTQKWLIEQVSQQTKLYFDRSYLCKIFKGTQKNKKIIAAINQVLEINGNMY